LEIFKRLPKKDYKDMADIEKELSKILWWWLYFYYLHYFKLLYVTS
jgi:hypothetical protein